MAQTPEQPDKVIEIIADGLDGPTLFYDDGTVEHIPVDRENDLPPPLTADLTFEERPGGFEIWYSDRIANDPVALAAELAKAGEHPEVILEATYGWYWAADVLEECGLAHSTASAALTTHSPHSPVVSRPNDMRSRRSQIVVAADQALRQEVPG